MVSSTHTSRCSFDRAHLEAGKGDTTRPPPHQFLPGQLGKPARCCARTPPLHLAWPALVGRSTGIGHPVARGIGIRGQGPMTDAVRAPADSLKQRCFTPSRILEAHGGCDMECNRQVCLLPVLFRWLRCSKSMQHLAGQPAPSNRVCLSRQPANHAFQCHVIEESAYKSASTDPVSPVWP